VGKMRIPPPPATTPQPQPPPYAKACATYSN